MKVVLVGPPASGKTVIVNSLCGFTRNEYSKTDSVRIMEYAPSCDNVKNVDLWDVSGDVDQQLYSVVFRNAQAVIFVYNPEVPHHLAVIEKWFQTVKEFQFTPEDCFVVGYGQNLDVSRTFHKPSKMASVGGNESRLNVFNAATVRDVSHTIDKFLSEVANSNTDDQKDPDEFD
eukprot:GDKJ01036874.1.p1 GENE.GDKJ01036874.1~~GDKJ01036874.1.p1  ORF type:complete len:174 (-),score=26.29 GDKJ01036874.1:20-541(-)